MRAPGKYSSDVKRRMPRGAHLTTSTAEMPGLAAPMPGRQDFAFQHSGEIIPVQGLTQRWNSSSSKTALKTSPFATGAGRYFPGYCCPLFCSKFSRSRTPSQFISYAYVRGNNKFNHAPWSVLINFKTRLMPGHCTHPVCSLFYRRARH